MRFGLTLGQPFYFARHPPEGESGEGCKNSQYADHQYSGVDEGCIHARETHRPLTCSSPSRKSVAHDVRYFGRSSTCKTPARVGCAVANGSAARAGAASLALEILPSPVENSCADFERVLDVLGRTPNCGFVATPDTTTTVHRDIVVALAAKHRLPAVYAFQFFVQAGGLMSYGVDPNENYRLGAADVDRILRGDKPAELPVQAPTRFEMSVNVKAAKAIGLTIPPGLIVAADEVIE